MATDVTDVTDGDIIITKSSFYHKMSIDLTAEKMIVAEREGQKIAVEIKSFLEQSSAISEFHTALGQFINYRAALLP